MKNGWKWHGLSPIDRFEKKFIAEPNTGCFIWTGAIQKAGYGTFYYDRSRGRLLAHRVAWELYNGPVSDDVWVLHHCDYRPCVNPTHLFLGDHLANMRDAMTKGRHVGVRLKGAKPYNFGNRQTECVRGHSQWYVNPNDGGRYCIPCNRAAKRAWKLKHGIGLR